MNLKSNTFALTLLLGTLSALSALATDTYLPSLPELTREMQATIPQGQLTLTLYLVGFASGQLVYGPISDRIGRRPVLLSALFALLVANIACAVAPTINWLIVARFLIGFATAGPTVLARSIVRDLYTGPRAAREMSMMGSIMGMVPTLAPFAGALIFVAFGWRAIFGVQVAFAGILILVVLLTLPETIGNRRKTDPLSLAAFPRAYRGLLASTRFRIYAGITSCMFCGLFSYLSVGSFLLQDVYGLDEVAFGICFSLSSVAFVVGTLLGGRIVPDIGIDRTITLGAALLVTGGVMMLVLVLARVSHGGMVVGPMVLYMAGVGVALPQGFAGALIPFPDRAGAASSMMGLFQVSSGAFGGAVVGYSFDGTALSLAISLTLTATAIVLINLHARFARHAPAVG